MSFSHVLITTHGLITRVVMGTPIMFSVWTDLINLTVHHVSIIFVFPAPLSEMQNQNDTLEERVTLLDFQVENLNFEVMDQGDEIDVIGGRNGRAVCRPSHTG